jgi:hypothetical protein
LGQFIKKYRTFYTKIVHKLSKIRDPENSIPDPGSRGEKDPGSGSATLVLVLITDFFRDVVKT